MFHCFILFHSVCNELILNCFGLLHPVSEFFLYILIVSFVTKQKWIFKKKKRKYVSSFHSVSLCFVTSIFQIFWSVSSCFTDFPLYLICFICYETEMGL